MKRARIFSDTAGLTIIEIVISIALIVIISGLGLYVLNPAGQLAKSRNSKRLLDLTGLMAAIRQNIADKNTGVFSCAAGDIPTTTRRMASSGAATSTYNIAPCLVPSYITSLPFDPSATGAHYASPGDYDTGYTILKNASSQIVLSAPSAEAGQTITVVR